MNERDEPTSVDPAALQRLRAHLIEHAGGAVLRATPSSDIAVRARRRTARRRLVGASASIVVLSGAAVTTALVSFVRNDRSPRVVPAESVASTDATNPIDPSVPPSEPTDPSTLASTTTSPPSTSAIAPSLEWTATDVGVESPLIAYHRIFAGPGGLYAWTSDEPAASNFASALQKSPDGKAWESVATSPDLGIMAITASETRIALLGYVPTATEGTESKVVVRLSDDDGMSWQTIPVPLTIPPRALGMSPTVRPTQAAIAMSGASIIVAVGVDVDTFPGEQPAPNDPSPIAPQIYVSDGARAFEAVTLESRPRGTLQSISLGEFDGGFLALATVIDGPTPTAPTLWRSPDGRTWRALGTVPVQDSDRATLGMVRDRYVVAPWYGETWISEDGSNWTASDFGGVLASGQRIAFDVALGPAGLTLIGLVPAPPHDIEIVKNGVVERLVGGTTSEIVFVEEATGAELGRVTKTPFDDGVIRATGDGTIDVLDGGGNVRTTFTIEDLTAALNAAALQSPPEYLILHSADAVTWSSTSINDLVSGAPQAVAWIRPAADSISVGVSVTTAESETPVVYVLSAATRSP